METHDESIGLEVCTNTVKGGHQYSLMVLFVLVATSRSEATNMVIKYLQKSSILLYEVVVNLEEISILLAHEGDRGGHSWHMGTGTGCAR